MWYRAIYTPQTYHTSTLYIKSLSTQTTFLVRRLGALVGPHGGGNLTIVLLGKHRLVTVQVVHLLLLGIVVAEEGVEDNGGEEGGDTDASVHPDELGVLGDGDEGKVEGATKGVGEEVHTLDKRLHGGGSLGVGVFKTGDGEENLGNTNEDIGRGLDGNVDVVRDNLAVDEGGFAHVTVAGVFVARASAVDEFLDNGGVGEAERGEEEANANTGNGAELNASLAQDRVDDAVENRGEDENGDGVKVLHEIVGHAVTLHLLGLGDKVGRELSVADPEDGVEDKDLAGTQGALDLVDEVVVPGNGVVLAVGRAPSRLGGVGAAVDNHDTNGLEGIGNDGALRGADNVRLAANDEDKDTNVEHAEAHEEGSPKAAVFLHKRRGHEGEGTDVDAPVEDHVNALVGDGGVNDDTLATLLGLDGHAATLVLVGNEGGNVRLDTTGTKTNNNNGNNVTSQASGVTGKRQGSDPENEKTDPVDTGKDDDGLVLAEVLVRNDGTENGSSWVKRARISA